jgi:hypothetical protein
MRLFFKDPNGQVYEYANQTEREQFGAADLVAMTDDEVADHLTPAAPAIEVPQKVTMRQARLALLAAGLLDDVEAAIDALTEPPRTAARIEWEFSSEVFRGREFVLMLGQALELDSAAMDALFIEAATL